MLYYNLLKISYQPVSAMLRVSKDLGGLGAADTSGGGIDT